MATNESHQSEPNNLRPGIINLIDCYGYRTQEDYIKSAEVLSQELNLKLVKYKNGHMHFYQIQDTGKLKHIKRDDNAILDHFGYDEPTIQTFTDNVSVKEPDTQADGYIGEDAQVEEVYEDPELRRESKFKQYSSQLKQLPSKLIVAAQNQVEHYKESIEYSPHKRKIIVGAVGAVALLGAYWLGTRTGTSFEANDFNILIDQNNNLIDQTNNLQVTIDQHQTVLDNLSTQNTHFTDQIDNLKSQNTQLSEQYDALMKQHNTLMEQQANLIDKTTTYGSSELYPSSVNLNKLPWDVANQLFPGREHQKINQAMETYANIYSVQVDWADRGQISINNHIMNTSELPRFNKILSSL